MDYRFKFRIKEIHDAVNSFILERTVNFVYDLLKRYMSDRLDDDHEFKVVGSIHRDGIEIEVITEFTDTSSKGMRYKPVKQGMRDQAGYRVLSKLSSARTSFRNVVDSNRSKLESAKTALRPIKDKVETVERGRLKTDLKRDASKLSPQQFIDSNSFKKEYERHLNEFMARNMDRIYEEIKSPISKVEENA